MWSVFFVFLSYLDRNFVKGEFLSSLDAEKESKELFYMLNNTLCARTSVAGRYHLHHVTDGVEEVRSVHDSQGRLVDCSVIRNEMQVKSFMHVCRIGLRDQKTNSDLKRSLTGVSEAKASCNKLKSRNVIVTTKQPKEANSDAADNNKTLRRSKRGFTYPGTLWCGAGNIAEHYDQLGEFAETDKCCRVHDHCPYVIHAFSSNYGYTNFKWHSLSHCDCDNALKECLRLVNDTSSRVVGQAFFNVIEVPCFEFSYEEQCVERHWYGMCKRYDKVPIAVIRESIPYDFGGIDVIDVLTIAPPKTKGSDEEKQDENKGAESTTQSTLSKSKTTAPEEPSLTNVVTAAEDFIKVLATVSTSQSSSAEAGKGETLSERKKKKNSGKKKKENKKKRGKGKGRKKNRKPDAVLKVDEGTSSAPSTSQTEEVMGKNILVEGHAKIETLRTKDDNFINSELHTVGNGPLSNKMMRDDPPRTVNESQEVVSASASTKKEEILERANNTESIAPTTRDMPIIPKLRHRSQKKKTRKTIADTKASPAEGVSLPASMTESPIMAVRKEMLHSTEHKEERGPVVGTFATQNTPIVRTKRPNSRQREGRKKMKKIFAPSTEPSQDLTSGDSQPLPGSDTRGVTDEEARVLERLGLDRLENLESLVTSSGAPVGTPKNRLQSLQGATVRRKFEEEHSNPSNDRRVIKICYEVVLPPETDQSMNPETTTAPTFILAQTNTPSTVTRTPRTTKMKRTRERGTREKKRKS
ncbi:uncharacterized protein proca1 [Triplophysa rosa]|uniref:phospholipase A2 n=1 Tax=Triplophysa rosa TaxID=992332 RepID=A0A9W7TQA6_TRIRA|nr:uncharacterized protein proca1 [Triplophysa rosa]KAI7800616.1 putative protein PROCA1 [Triplophysa rosa]